MRVVGELGTYADDGGVSYEDWAVAGGDLVDAESCDEHEGDEGSHNNRCTWYWPVEISFGDVLFSSMG